MEVYELKVKVYLLQNIQYKDIYEKIAYFIDCGLILDEKFLKLHNKNTYKYYSFSSFFPLEKDKIYKKDNIYTITLRTISSDLAEHIVSNMNNHVTKEIKTLIIDIKKLKEKDIEKIYCITPAILKTEKGYWRNIISLEDFENRIKINLIKKYNNFYNTKLNEDFELFNSIKFNNIKPIGVSYKGRKLIGDKVEIVISEDEYAQKLAYMALGTGILEMNPRGLGFVNAKFY